jgi:Ca2+-binding RTX toxin-like protein
MNIKMIRGTNGDDTRRGSGVDEKILGLGGDDRLEGLSGNDWLLGGTGEDFLLGGAGNDRLNGGTGEDRLSGGSGDDLYILGQGDLIGGETSQGGIDTIQAAFSIGITSSTFANFENVTLVGGKALDSVGNNRNNTLTGNRAVNQLTGGRGNDTLIGLEGSDRLDGGIGRDLLIGGLGNDTYGIDNTGDRVTEAANEGREDAIRTVVNYSLTLAPNVETLILVGTAFDGEGNDLDNELIGTSGSNSLRGGLGSDRLEGDGSVDSLDGGAGNDSLTGGGGNDVLVGGAGEDEFIYDDAGDPGQDSITDFTIGSDTIVLDKDTFTVLASQAGGTGFSVSSEFARVSRDSDVASSRAIIVYSTQSGGLFYRAGGVSGAFAVLTGVPNLSASDFVIQS